MNDYGQCNRSLRLGFLKALGDAWPERLGQAGVGYLDRRLPSDHLARRKVRVDTDLLGALRSGWSDDRKPLGRRAGHGIPRIGGPRLQLPSSVVVPRPGEAFFRNRSAATVSGCTRPGSGHKWPIHPLFLFQAIDGRPRGGYAPRQKARSGNSRPEARSCVFRFFEELTDVFGSDDFASRWNQFESIADFRSFARIGRGQSGSGQFGKHLTSGTLGFGGDFLHRLQHVWLNIESCSHGENLMHLMRKSSFDAKEVVR